MCERSVPRLRAWDALRNGLFALKEQFVFPRSSNKAVTHPTQAGRKWDKYSKGFMVLEKQVMVPLEHFWGGRGATGCDSSIRDPTVALLWLPQIDGNPPKSSRGKHRGMESDVPNPGGNQDPESRSSCRPAPPFSPGAVCHQTLSLQPNEHRALVPGLGTPRPGGAAGTDSGSDTSPDTSPEPRVTRRRRRRRPAAAVAERSRPAQLLSRGGTHGLVTFDIFYTIF